jgi:archaellin
VPLLSPTLTGGKSKDADVFILPAAGRQSIELSTSPSSSNQQQDIGQMVWSVTRQSTAKPGRAQRLKSEASLDSESSSSSKTIEERLKSQKEDNSKQVQQIQKTLTNEENRRLDEECLQRFIKVNVRLMTDDHVSRRFVELMIISSFNLVIDKSSQFVRIFPKRDEPLLTRKKHACLY